MLRVLRKFTPRGGGYGGGCSRCRSVLGRVAKVTSPLRVTQAFEQVEPVPVKVLALVDDHGVEAWQPAGPRAARSLSGINSFQYSCAAGLSPAGGGQDIA
jgi:hypothetical protein